MKILVTGASGFVGGALWREAKRRGYEVRAVGRRILPDPDYESVDLAAGFNVDFQPDVVIHAAARSSPWGTRRDFYAQNVRATENVVSFCETHGRPWLLHVSTSAVVYEERHQLNLDESAPLPTRSVNLYAETKRKAEEVVARYTGSSCIVRPRAVFGPGDTVVFPRILKAARAGRLPLLESDEPVVGDLIYIETLVDYLLIAAERRAVGVYFLTNNKPVPILEFLFGVFAQLDLPVPSRRVPVARALRFASSVEGIYRLLPFLGEPPVTRFGVGVFAYSKTFNVAKALRDLGQPSVALGDGVDRFVRWQKTVAP
jgi:nucleoside-diphosphate-sugar epimerase